MAVRAVSDDERPEHRKKMTVFQAAESGSHRALLIATRDRIAAAVDSEFTLARDLASLTKRLTDIARELAAIEAQSKDQEGVQANDASTDDTFDAEAV